jgi:hypothetical protein
MSFEERCYVVYGKGFAALKIKGMSNKNKLMDSLRLKGLKPKSSGLSAKKGTCKTVPTLYLN